MPKYSHPYKPNPGGAADTPQGGAQDFASRVDRKVEEIDRRTDEFSRSLDDVVSDLAGIGAGVGAELLDGLAGVITSAGDAFSRWAQRDKDLTFPQWRARLDRRLLNNEQGGYLAMAIAGGVFAVGFGITALVMFCLSAVGPEALQMTRADFNVFPILMAVFTPLTVGFGIMTGFGVKKFRFFGRIRSYLRAAHDWVGSVPAIARAAGRDTAQVRSELNKAITDGKLPGVVLSDDGDTVYFKEELYEAEAARRAQTAAPQGGAQTGAADTPLAQFEADTRDFLAYLTSCRGRLDAAADEELAAMHKNCAVILGFIHNHPGQLGQVRRFAEYYLPTTRKLLDTALGLGAADAANAQAIRRDITGILHTLNAAYATLYDTLLQDVSLDVSTEIDTLETMLRQDGLTQNFKTDFKPGAR